MSKIKNSTDRSTLMLQADFCLCLVLTFFVLIGQPGETSKGAEAKTAHKGSRGSTPDLVIHFDGNEMFHLNGPGSPGAPISSVIDNWTNTHGTNRPNTVVMSFSPNLRAGDVFKGLETIEQAFPESNLRQIIHEESPTNSNN